jgi:hypothetical protein
MKSASFEVWIKKLQTNGKRTLQSFRLDKIVPLIKGSGIIKLLRYINTASTDNSTHLHTDEIESVNVQFNKDILETMSLTGLDLQTWLTVR